LIPACNKKPPQMNEAVEKETPKSKTVLRNPDYLATGCG
jgi:hypothetical protein